MSPEERPYNEAFLPDDPSRDFDILRIRRNDGYYGPVFPVMAVLRGTDPQSSANFSTPFFRADRNYELLSVTERHETAATDGSLTLRKVPSGTAPASGTAMLSSAMPLTGTANTDQTGTVSVKLLAKGECLALEATGLLTLLTGVTVSVALKSI